MSDKPTKFDIRSTWLRSIAFVVGFSVMTFELISGRFMAPYLGSSLYTWTAVLMAILSAVAIGSYMGGKFASHTTIISEAWIWLILSAGLISLATLVFMEPLGAVVQMSHWPIIILTLAFSFFIFFPPALTLAVLMPLLVKTDIQTIEMSGSRLGSLAAWNAAGSILGTYMTGFFFTSYMHTKQVVLVIIAILILASVVDLYLKTKHRAV